MGAILAKFKKSRTTCELLEELEEKIQAINHYTLNTQLQKKKFVGSFLAISIGVYVIAFFIFYFIYFPPTWKERLAYSVPLFVFPTVVYLLRRVFTWHFERKLTKKSKELAKLRLEKKKMLEQVMEKETYKVATQLLERFGEKENKFSMASTPRPAMNASHAIRALSDSKTELTNSSTQMTPSATSLHLTSPLSTSLPRQQMSRSMNSIGNHNMSASLMISPLSANRNSTVGVHQELRRRRTPFPIVNQENKGVFERIVDILIGDGPQDRFAMICKKCFSHNGMALKEEFDYTTFRCAFCNEMNPARKERPVGPRLPLQQTLLTRKNASNSESSSTDNESDSDTHSVPSVEMPQLEIQEIDNNNDLNTQVSALSINKEQNDQQSETNTVNNSIEKVVEEQPQKVDKDQELLEKLSHEVEELEKNFMHLEQGADRDKINDLLLESKIKKLAL